MGAGEAKGSRQVSHHSLETKAPKEAGRCRKPNLLPEPRILAGKVST
jgi:hypothetical protein